MPPSIVLPLRIIAPLFLVIGAGSCSDSSRTDTATQPTGATAKPAATAADEHVRFTISGPELEKTTYTFDPKAFEITSGGNSALIRAMKVQAEDGTPFTALQLGVTGVPGPGSYSSREHSVVASWAFTPIAGAYDRAMASSKRTDLVLVLSSTTSDDHVKATFSGTVEWTNRSGKPVFTIEDGSLLVRSRK